MQTALSGLAAAVVLVAAAASQPRADAGPARDLLRAAEGMLQSAGPAVTPMIAAAEKASERAVAGGEVYLAGDRGFVSEALGRAGGLMLVKGLPAAGRVAKGDVVLLAPMPGDGDADLSRRLREAGALVLAFDAPAGFPADYVLSITEGRPAFPEAPTGAGIPVAATLRRVVALWAWTGEFVAACTRRGKMPAMWQSIHAPGGRERNEPLRSRGVRFHDDLGVAPIAAGTLGAAYLKELGSRVGRLRSRELRHLEEAGARTAATLARGGRAHAWTMGHILPYVIGAPGEAHPFPVLPGEIPADGAIAAGDILLAVAYTGIPEAALGPVAKAGAGAVWIIAPAGPDDAARRRGDLVIDQQWRPGDAIVQVPGYDVPILPPSAVTQLLCYWSIAAECAARRPGTEAAKGLTQRP